MICIDDNVVWFLIGILDGLIIAYWFPRILDYVFKERK